MSIRRAMVEFFLKRRTRIFSKRWNSAFFFLAFCLALVFGTSQALAVKAIAHCSATGLFGLGEGETAAEATDDAVSKCIIAGGIPGCCHLLVTTEDASCVALATGPNAQRGVGSSNNQGRAERMAMQSCPAYGCQLQISVCENDD
jgi:hypothetical protein